MTGFLSGVADLYEYMKSVSDRARVARSPIFDLYFVEILAVGPCRQPATDLEGGSVGSVPLLLSAYMGKVAIAPLDYVEKCPKIPQNFAFHSVLKR